MFFGTKLDSSMRSASSQPERQASSELAESGFQPAQPSQIESGGGRGRWSGTYAHGLHEVSAREVVMVRVMVMVRL